MNTLTRYLPWALLCTCLFITACDNPEATLDQARSSRERADFERVITRHPGTPFADEAQAYLNELDEWKSIQDSRKVKFYQDFIDEHPQGLFAVDAQAGIDDVLAWEFAKREDIRESYVQYLQRTTAPLLYKDRAHVRRKELEASELVYSEIEENADLETLQAVNVQLTGTGYSALLYTRLAQAAEKSARDLIAEDERFQEISSHLDNLPELIAGKDKTLAKLARLAREERRILVLTITGGGGEFVLPGIEVHSKSAGNRFSITDSSKNVGTNKNGAVTSLNLSFEGSMAQSPPDDVNCYSASGNATSTIFFTDLDGDLVPFKLGMFKGMHMNGTGATQTIGFDAIHCASGSVWRFSGNVNPIPGIRIIADPTDPLSFYLLEAVGPVFLAGRGRVVDATGHVLFETGNLILPDKL